MKALVEGMLAEALDALRAEGELCDRGELTVIDSDGDSLAPRARYEVATAATWAHPLFTDHGVVIKDVDTVALLAFETTTVVAD